MQHGSLSFLLIGTPRSGTTLLQRFVSGFEGVRVPPETHFFSIFVPRHVRLDEFPLNRSALMRILDLYATEGRGKRLVVDPPELVEIMGGTCASVWELFESIVRYVGGPAERYGEKTPSHLPWWEPIARAFPSLKIIAIVRDPRAVVASNLRVKWGMKHPPVLAMRWRVDQLELVKAQNALGDSRFLITRYEDLVAQPEQTISTLQTFIGSTFEDRDFGPGDLFHEWETWKAAALEPLMPERLDAWKESLSPVQRRTIEGICGTMMRRFGYTVPAGTKGLGLTLARLSPMEHRRLGYFLYYRRRRKRYINRVTREVAPVS